MSLPVGEVKNSSASDLPTPNPENLDAPPFFRGAIDTFDGSHCTGWALSAVNPLRPIAVEVLVAGVHVMTVLAGDTRADLTRLIGIPVQAGFKLDLANAPESKAREALRALRSLEATRVEISSVLSVQIEGTGLPLPMSSELATGTCRPSDIAERLAIAAGSSTVDLRATLGRDLLTSHPIRVATPKDNVQVLAYYLPQFHPFAENDEWWGTGFTEWTNVTTAKPLFPGHHQPQLPADLGFYDLRLDQVQRDQIELARRYGVTGFVYYYYWFSGKTLMTLPIDRHVEQDLDHEFCLCWANESWSRRWDGSENDVLIGQRHDFQSDVEFIRSCIRYFRSPRYIKIDGAPLLQVYRISLLERPFETMQRWREIVREEGFPDLHISMVEAFGLNDPAKYGCDSSVQFPPHGIIADAFNHKIEDLDPGFNGYAYSYAEVLRNEMTRPAPAHLRFRTAMPSWDNTARKGKGSHIFVGATPALFETWMNYLVADAMRRLPPGKRMVFVNAWNEWAEGTHLEPDRRYGHANLRAVRNALAPANVALAPLLAPEDGAGDDSFAETRRYVESLLTANRELTRLIRRDRYDLRLFEEQRPVLCTPDLLTVTDSLVGKCNVESVNGRVIGGSDILIRIDRETGFTARGWLVIQGQNVLQILLSLRNDDGPRDRRYVVQLRARDRREDVATAFALDDKTDLCGFHIAFTLRDLPPGRYTVEFLAASAQHPDKALSLATGLQLGLG